MLQKILPTLISRSEPIIFDVGANIGQYSNALLDTLPTAIVHAFEPSSEVFCTLKGNVHSNRIATIMMGMSDRSGSVELFDYPNRASSHASLYSEVLIGLHHAKSVRKTTVALTTLDEYCAEHCVKEIDFIKIDTEGHELAVLKGGKRMIESGLLPLIQFEFNEMNAISRVFLKDFYSVLEGYQFFRLMPNGLLPLGPYSSRNEIFAFQNILAVLSQSYPSGSVDQFVVQPPNSPPKRKIS